MTPEGGLAVRYTNGTGATSVKGTLVSPSTANPDTVDGQTSTFDAIGAVYENGVPDGAPVWVVCYGKADVLVDDNNAGSPGDWCRASATHGRGLIATAPAGIGAVVAAEHFKEIGHLVQTCASGTDQLAKIHLHFL